MIGPLHNGTCIGMRRYSTIHICHNYATNESCIHKYLPGVDGMAADSYSPQIKLPVNFFVILEEYI